MSEWKMVNKSRPCVICNKTSWCTYTTDGAVVKCMRVDEGAYKHQTDGSGVAHFHRVGESKPRPYSPSMTKREKTKINEPDCNIDRVTAVVTGRLTDRILHNQARQLCVSPESLRALGAGWRPRKRAMAFPMRRHDGRVIGIRYRNSKGRKFAHKGSRNGLFIPTMKGRTGPVFLPEGPTDTMALWDMGLIAVGRPNVSARMDLVAELLTRWRRSLVIVGENDGGDGYDVPPVMARQMKRRGVDARVIYPPAKFEDVRDWKRAGATADDLMNLLSGRGGA